MTLPRTTAASYLATRLAGHGRVRSCLIDALQEASFELVQVKRRQP